MTKLTVAQRKALLIIAEGPMSDYRRIISGVQLRTLYALRDMGMIRYAPYANDPHWRITQEGKTYLSNTNEEKNGRF